MNRHLTPAPAQYDMGQMRAAAAATLPSLVDVNTVDNGDGTTSIAAYTEGTPTQAQLDAWASSVSSAAYAPDQTAANAKTLSSRAASALSANATFLGLASPSNAQVVAQVQALTKECSALIRLLLGQFDSTAGT